MTTKNSFGAFDRMQVQAGQVGLYRLEALEKQGIGVQHLPYSIRVLLEAALRQEDGFAIGAEAVRTIAAWSPETAGKVEIPFKPARVVLQDFTGVPSLVDLAALRTAMQAAGGDPRAINPQVPVDLVVDHSVQVDHFGSDAALANNAQREFERNRERYTFLKWGQEAFENFRVVPPATGIVHQVNLEYLASVVQRREVDGETLAFPDSLVGTDSHTPMINGLGVVGWGVGGIEAEAAMLGQPIYMLLPEVVGLELKGHLPPGVTATDLVLRITELLRAEGVVGKFVEFFGAGADELSLPDRALISNMSPEQGSTIGYWPVDEQTLDYLRLTGRSAEQVDLVERYCKTQGLFRQADSPTPRFSKSLSLDLSQVEPALAGPKRPADRVALSGMKELGQAMLSAPVGPKGFGLPTDKLQAQAVVERGSERFVLEHGAVIIAAITSCTNTSNPDVMLAAGLLAKKAVEAGLRSKPWVKTSLAPGSKVVTRYLDKAGLMPYLKALGFHAVGYGCTTCIGNSGPLPDDVDRAVREAGLVAASVLSGNRNFEGRIHPLSQANFLASPPLVVAFALAGSVMRDLSKEPVGHDPNGRPVMLADIWPSAEELAMARAESLGPEDFLAEYAQVFSGNPDWNQVPVGGSELYDWQADSSYIRLPPFFEELGPQLPELKPLSRARVLAMLPDSTTTDHISPAGNIAGDSPAARYLKSMGVEEKDFNSYGSRRGNHEVMMRGTFANIRIKNGLLPGVEGGETRHMPSGEQLSIWDAAERYMEEGCDLIILAGKEYGSGSSRDWAAKGPRLQGVKAVIAESYERIHRSNLVGMGILPLQFMAGESVQSLGLNGQELFSLVDFQAETMEAGQRYTARAEGADGAVTEFQVLSRIDTPVEVDYLKNGGILHMVLRRMLSRA